MIVPVWFLGRLRRQRRMALPVYDELRQWLASLEQALRTGADPAGRNETDAGPSNQTGQVTPEALSIKVRSSSPIIYRPVTMKNGTRFDVAFDRRWLRDDITRGVAGGDPWFLDDFYVLLDRMRQGDAVLDLGGHIGTFALAAAALGCRVVCVEAAPGNVALLNASVARNGFDHMQVVWGAATDHEGTLSFIPHGPWGTIANASVTRSPEAIYATTLAPVDVPALTVDDLLHRLKWERVDFVKMDIEGSEVTALRAMAGLLAGPDAPILLYESNVRALGYFGSTPRQLDATLREFGYTSYIVKSGRLEMAEPDTLQPDSVVNYLAMKGKPTDFAG